MKGKDRPAPFSEETTRRIGQGMERYFAKQADGYVVIAPRTLRRLWLIVAVTATAVAFNLVLAVVDTIAAAWLAVVLLKARR